LFIGKIGVVEEISANDGTPHVEGKTRELFLKELMTKSCEFPQSTN
jgi:hypothetical protein